MLIDIFGIIFLALPMMYYIRIAIVANICEKRINVICDNRIHGDSTLEWDSLYNPSFEKMVFVQITKWTYKDFYNE